MSNKTARQVGGIACFLAVMLFLAVIADSRTVYATPDRQSAFLREYTPENTIKGFAIPNWGVTGSSGNSAGAGVGEARFRKDFDSRFVIRPEDRHWLSMALTETIVAMIADTGAQLTEQTGNENNGFQFKYTEGKSAGTITLGPVVQLGNDHSGANGSGLSKPWFRFLNPDEIPVEVQMTIRETWTR
jgi:hypothetical protein